MTLRSNMLRRSPYGRIFTRKNGSRKKVRLYIIWDCMRQRCYDQKHKSYPRYGGRGVRICSEWRSDYDAFRSWAVANGYSKGLTIDRIDSDGDYSPENCRWVTRDDQMRNRPNNVMVTYDGRTMCATDWARELGLNPSGVLFRIRNGWDPVAAVSTPPVKGRRSRAEILKTQTTEAH